MVISNARRRKKEYYSRKYRKLCAETGCSNPPSLNRVRCRIHLKKQMQKRDIMKFNVMDLLTSRQHKTIVAIAQRDGFIEKRVVQRLYVTSESARNALDFLWGLKILRPTENGNKWIYTKFEKDNTAQKKLEVKPQLMEEK